MLSTAAPATPVAVRLPEPVSAANLKDRLRRIRDALTEGLIERDIPVRLALLAAIAGEHILLIGPPGTAKSELARRLKPAFTGQTYFERLLTKFSVPEELFGPLSIKALERDEYLRQIQGYLPTASVAFLDEIFKANSAILNSLLTLLNEREFDNGTQRIKTPLVSVVGASNEGPWGQDSGAELDALYDRFLVRYHVGPVTDDGFARLLELRGHATPAIEAALVLTKADLDHIHAAALTVKVPVEVASLLKAMRTFCREQNIKVSDRRWRKALFLLQVAAHTDGRAAVSVWDCWLLQHCLWHKPEEHATMAKWYEDRAGAASPREPERFVKVAAAWEQRLQEDCERNKSRKQDEHGRPLYRGPDGKETTEEKGHYPNVGWKHNEKVFNVRSFSRAHVDGRTEGVEAASKEVNHFVFWSNQQMKQLEQDIRGHLWLDAAFAAPAVRNLQGHVKRASDILARLEAAKQGFQELPVEKDMEELTDADVSEPHIYEIGDRVGFEADGLVYTGKITAIEDDDFTVQSDDEREWTLAIDDISPAT